MKAKSFVLLVLILATLFTVSCHKKADPTPDPTPAYTPPEATTAYEGILFTLQENGWYLAELTAEAKASFDKETLVIPGFIPGETATPVETVGSFGFQGLTTLKKVVVSYPIIKIGAQAFEGCTALEKVELPHSLESIGTWAFAGCSALTSINLPKNIFGIGSEAFKGCTALAEITYEGTIEEWGAVASHRTSSWLVEGKTITVHCTDGDVTA